MCKLVFVTVSMLAIIITSCVVPDSLELSLTSSLYTDAIAEC